MKNRFKFLFIFVIVLLATILTACNASDNGIEYDSGAADDSTNNVVVETTRKIYYIVDYNIICDDYSEIKLQIYDKVNALSGYVQKSTDREKSAEYTYRVPTSKLNEFLDYVDDFGDNVTSKTVNSTDVTSSYSAIEAKKEVLTASRTAYLAILNSKELSMTEIISIQDKISEIDIEIATIERELASYDNLLDYSTITIDYSSKYKPKGFLAQYGEYLGDFFTGLGKGILYLLPVMLCGAVVCLAVFGGIKLKKKMKNKDDK